MSTRTSAHVIRRADHQTQPWKNGGGETTELAIAPEGATLESFDWRLSIARITAPGPFSLFPGCDRTLALLDGPGVLLASECGGKNRVTPTRPIISFAGEERLYCTPLQGPSTDFNFITRRDRFAHSVISVSDSTGRITLNPHMVSAILCVTGAVTVSYEMETLTLSPYDLFYIADGDSSLAVAAVGRCLSITLRPRPMSAATAV